MDSSKLGNWLQIVGNAGLIVGLVLVAVQVRQNTEIAKAQIVNEGWISLINTRHVLMGDNPAASLAKARARHALSDEDLEVLNAILEAAFADLIRAEYMGDFGFTQMTNELRGRQFARSSLDNPASRAWWVLRHKTPQGHDPIPNTRKAINESLDSGMQRENRDADLYAEWRSAIENSQN